nr:SDR family oxidoreductase [Shewanella vesiculosa]
MSQSTQYQDLKNKVIFITGGASGIGAAMVEAFSRQQAKVAFILISTIKPQKRLSKNYLNMHCHQFGFAQ